MLFWLLVAGFNLFINVMLWRIWKPREDDSRLVLLLRRRSAIYSLCTLCVSCKITRRGCARASRARQRRSWPPPFRVGTISPKSAILRSTSTLYPAQLRLGLSVAMPNKAPPPIETCAQAVTDEMVKAKMCFTRQLWPVLTTGIY